MLLPPLTGRLVHLIHFQSWMVPRYLEWISDPEVQEMTETPASFADINEIETMRRKWNHDNDLFNFIIVVRDALPTELDLQLTEAIRSYSQDPGRFFSTCERLPASALVGDVGVFYIEDAAEISFMVADRAWRRRGVGSEAVALLATCPLKNDNLLAKVSTSNVAARCLFEKLGFETQHVDETFNEVHLVRRMQQ